MQDSLFTLQLLSSLPKSMMRLKSKTLAQKTREKEVRSPDRRDMLVNKGVEGNHGCIS